MYHAHSYTSLFLFIVSIFHVWRGVYFRACVPFHRLWGRMFVTRWYACNAFIIIMIIIRSIPTMRSTRNHPSKRRRPLVFVWSFCAQVRRVCRPAGGLVHTVPVLAYAEPDGAIARDGGQIAAI